MIKVYQTIFDHIHGDCMRACVASIFEIPSKLVPNFMAKGKEYYNESLDAWALQMNLRAIDITFSDISNFKDIYMIAVVSYDGEDPQEIRHAVAYLNGVMVHDPMPKELQKGYILTPPLSFTIFSIIDPSKHPLPPIKKDYYGQKRTNNKIPV